MHRLAPLALILIAACAPSRLGASPPADSTEPSPSDVPSISADAETGVGPHGCGALTTYDYLIGGYPAFETPREALTAFLANVRAQKPPDDEGRAIRAALLAAGELVMTTGASGGHVRYEARVGNKLLGAFEVTGEPTGGFVVTSTWMPMPEAFCPTGDRRY
jgi:hypothetical protein